MSDKLIMREISEFDHSWALELAPHFYEDKRKNDHLQKYTKEIEKKVEYDKVFEKKEETVPEFLQKRIKGIKERAAAAAKKSQPSSKNQRKNFRISDDIDDI